MKNIKKLALCVALLGIVSVFHASFVKRGFNTSGVAVQNALNRKIFLTLGRIMISIGVSSDDELDRQKFELNRAVDQAIRLSPERKNSPLSRRHARLAKLAEESLDNSKEVLK